MVVTINTDASYHFQHKIGAYSFWIVCDEGRVLKSGALKEKISNPDEAELQCIINALYAVSKQGWKNIARIVINTDSLNSIHVFTNKKSEIKKYRLNKWSSLRGKFNSIKSNIENSSGVRTVIKFNHIRSHQNTETARAWVNEWCDKAAKKALWDKINSPK